MFAFLDYVFKEQYNEQTIYHNVRTFPKSNRQNRSRDRQKSIPQTKIHDHPLS